MSNVLENELKNAKNDLKNSLENLSEEIKKLEEMMLDRENYCLWDVVRKKKRQEEERKEKEFQLLIIEKLFEIEEKVDRLIERDIPVVTREVDKKDRNFWPEAETTAGFSRIMKRKDGSFKYEIGVIPRG